MMVPLVELEQQHCVVWECVHLTQQHQPGQQICHPDRTPHYLTERPAVGGPEIDRFHITSGAMVDFDGVAVSIHLNDKVNGTL